ncbi:MAG: hypothetical protein JRJ29_20540 [Deltaproteobacteria bacterium]|nr:hypothetical protein [Deltaproteobacteria bacterium]
MICTIRAIRKIRAKKTPVLQDSLPLDTMTIQAGVQVLGDSLLIFDLTTDDQSNMNKNKQDKNMLSIHILTNTFNHLSILFTVRETGFQSGEYHGATSSIMKNWQPVSRLERREIRNSAGLKTGREQDPLF